MIDDDFLADCLWLFSTVLLIVVLLNNSSIIDTLTENILQAFGVSSVAEDSSVKNLNENFETTYITYEN